jgi:hypothetical protein
MGDEMNTTYDLYRFAQENTLEKVAALLAWYVANEEPDGFCGTYATTRAMCAVASWGLTGEPYPQGYFRTNYLYTQYGPWLYNHMWSSMREF